MLVAAPVLGGEPLRPRQPAGAAEARRLVAPSAGPTAAERLRREGRERFLEERLTRSRAEVRALQREQARHLERLRLRTSDDPEAVERAAERWRREAERDAVAVAVDLDALERRLGRPLGPRTREILERRLRPARTLRDAEREAELDALRRDAGTRDATPERELLEVPGPVPEALR
jgi:hypothetical protein